MKEGRRAADPRLVVSAARGWLGTPYCHQASVKGAGCDCLGLARGIWREILGPEPLDAWGGRLPAYSRDWGEAARQEVLADAARRVGMIEVALPAARACPPPGTLVLFRPVDRDGCIAKHCGVIVEPDRMIHAREGRGVTPAAWAPWSRRARFAFLFPAVEG